MRGRLTEHWLTLVPRNWIDAEPELILRITCGLPADRPLNENDFRDLHSFAHGYRGFDLALPVLRRLSLQAGVVNGMADERSRSLWARAVLQGWSWPELQANGECVGREAGEAELRSLVGDILQNRPDL